MKNTHLFWPTTSVFKQLKMWTSQHELGKRYTVAGSTLAQSVPNQLRIKFSKHTLYTCDQANIHPGDSRDKEIMPFSTKINEKVFAYTSKRREMLTV